MAKSLDLELWGGIECTVNRVGSRYFDQLERNGHAYRPEDLEMIATLGIQTIRYPILWERVAPDALASADWSWPDERLSRLRALQMIPIVGLVHHGSGPAYTSLLDPAFPDKLSAYATLVARRYPWLQYYTPVNEPLTTARFSGLYGHWYPHGQNDLDFAQCLLNQCRGIVLAMRAIRQINPDAKLIQTEDLGKVYSTPLLQYQADLENERRWLSFDLLCGHLKPGMPMWDFFKQARVPEKDLWWFLENPCPPDIIGINHYLTSDRYLDENVEAYPPEFRGGNGRHVYADEAVVRVNVENCEGIRRHLRDAWERYGLPIAVTEAHLGCSREEQLRWLKDIWQTAHRLWEDGIDIRAVTAWSLLGSYDWNCLVTQESGFYEPGAFDLRGGYPRPTAIAKMISQLCKRRDFHHPVLDMPGWWHRSDRFFYPTRMPAKRQSLNFHLPSQDCAMTGVCNVTTIRPVIIVGANGTLGRAFARICDIRGIPYYLLSRRELNLCDLAQVESTLHHFHPWAVINAAGYVRVDDAEAEYEQCWLDNVVGPVNLAKACSDLNLPLVTFSSDLVFCGTVRRPYLESDPVNPLNVYGQSKAEAEKQVLAIQPDALVIRTSAFFGPWDDYNFVTIALRQLLAGEQFFAASDMHISPTYVPDLVNASLDLLIDGEKGLWHLSNHTEISWYELARMAAIMQGLNTSLIQPCARDELSYTAARPLYSVLETERCKIMPDLGDAMFRYMRETKVPA
jgi:dTDP-4-dehydrorhamnose reductase